MKSAFFKLEEEKRKRIIDASMNEFGSKGYDKGSLNNIIKEAGISKGGMFKYIENKKDLYLFVFEEILGELLLYQCNNVRRESRCYIDRLQEMMESGFDYYEGRDLNFKFIINALTDITSSLFSELQRIKNEKMKAYGGRFFSDIDWSLYNVEKEILIETLEYLIRGCNLSLMEQLKEISTMEKLREKISEKLNGAMNIVRVGVRRREDDKIQY